MPTTKQKAYFLIDGYEVSATFAEIGNPTIIGQVKQILLSSFVSRPPIFQDKGILDDSVEQRDNNSGGSPHVP